LVRSTAQRRKKVSRRRRTGVAQARLVAARAALAAAGCGNSDRELTALRADPLARFVPAGGHEVSRSVEPQNGGGVLGKSREAHLERLTAVRADPRAVSVTTHASGCWSARRRAGRSHDATVAGRSPDASIWPSVVCFADSARGRSHGDGRLAPGASDSIRTPTASKGRPMTAATTSTFRQRVDALDWGELREQLDSRGHAITAPLLNDVECDEHTALFDAGRFRTTIDMARHSFGAGRYRYFDHPLPDTIAELRSSFYRHLAPVANDWSELLRGDNPTFPLAHDDLLKRCRDAGQERPTPLILRYGEGDWNALHQDLYGDVYFPFQIVTILSEPDVDFEGGEFVLVEQRPRAQSRAHVLKPPRGAFVIFPTQQRPNKGKNGYHRVGMRHGVSTVTRGQRTAMGIIFHDSK
jgi:uncharacterized protein